MSDQSLRAHLQGLFDLQHHAGALREQAAIEDRLAARHTTVAEDLRREADQVMADAARIEAEWDG